MRAYFQISITIINDFRFFNNLPCNWKPNLNWINVAHFIPRSWFADKYPTKWRKNEEKRRQFLLQSKSPRICNLSESHWEFRVFLYSLSSSLSLRLYYLRVGIVFFIPRSYFSNVELPHCLRNTNEGRFFAEVLVSILTAEGYYKHLPSQIFTYAHDQSKLKRRP